MCMMYVFIYCIYIYQHQANSNDSSYRQYYVGSDAQAKRELLSLRYPIEKGEITDWDSMQKIWEWTFEKELELERDMYKVPVLMTDTPLSSRKSREVNY